MIVSKDILLYKARKQIISMLKVAGWILDSVIGIFYWLNPSGRTKALGSTEPTTEMSTRITRNSLDG
jgi:hypothetical protein